MTNEMTSKEAIEFLELEKESTKTLWDNVNHEGGREYFEKSLEVIDIAIKALKEQLMRDATEEERKSVKDYIESISKPTGVHFDEAQPSEDCISREEVQDLISRWLSDYLLDETREALEVINYKVGDMPSVTPRRDLAETSQDCVSRKAVRKILVEAKEYGSWDDSSQINRQDALDYVDMLPSVTPQYTDEEIDKAQAVEQAYVDKMVEMTVEELRREWLNSFDTSSATKCFEAVNLLKQRLEGEE